jgi:hypothetical protein
MAGFIPAARQHLIDAISASARRLTRSEDRAALLAFVRAYYRGVDEDDLRTSPPESLAAAAAGHLAFGLRRRPGAPLEFDGHRPRRLDQRPHGRRGRHGRHAVLVARWRWWNPARSRST